VGVIPFVVEDTAGRQGGSALLDRILDRLRNTLNSLSKAVTNERLVTTSLGTTPTQVFHGMNGPPVAWEIVGRSAGEVVYEPAIVNGNRNKYLYLQATGAVNVVVRFS
jgi:hypothetical protein